MFNFTNQKAGTIAGLGGEPTPQTKIVERTKYRDLEIDGKDIYYWSTLAKGLKEQMKGIIDERDEAIRVAMERRANDAGLRAVIRYLLAELRKQNPESPLLNKKVRDKIFEEFHKQEMEKVLALNGLEKVWEPLERPDEMQTP